MRNKGENWYHLLITRLNRLDLNSKGLREGTSRDFSVPGVYTQSVRIFRLNFLGGRTKCESSDHVESRNNDGQPSGLTVSRHRPGNW